MSYKEPYKWVKVQNGIGYVGVITLEVHRKNLFEPNEIIQQYVYTDYGVPERWKNAIIQGLNYALSKVDTKWKVIVTGFEGTYVDTNPTIAAFTAMLGLWSKIEFHPDLNFVKEVEDFIVKHFLENSIPDFEKFEQNK
jgi:hypothetical protein